jgi:hypothetical protein
MTGMGSGDIFVTKPSSPLAFAQGLVEHLADVRITEDAVDEAKNFLRARRALRKKLPKKESAYEYVVELAIRPTITRYATNELGISTSDSSPHIYSSHFHTTSDPEKEWERKWRRFKRAYPEMDTDDAGHSRRADLFIAMGNAGLVSVEFKHVRAKTNPSLRECVRQIRQHLTKHSASVLVLYAAIPVSMKLESTVRRIRDDLRGHNGFVVVVAGPPVEFPQSKPEEEVG